MQEILKSGNAIRRFKDVEDVNTFAFLLDSTLNLNCNDDLHDKSSSSEEFDYRFSSENATAIWNLQLQVI